jgi:hypothetical protein
MKLEIKNFKRNSLSVLRQAGYFFQRREGEEMSFTKPLSKSGYPRFHAYAALQDAGLIIRIHLDRKKETYGKNKRHHGEYKNKGALKEEVERLKNILSS